MIWFNGIFFRSNTNRSTTKPTSAKTPPASKQNSNTSSPVTLWVHYSYLTKTWSLPVTTLYENLTDHSDIDDWNYSTYSQISEKLWLRLKILTHKLKRKLLKQPILLQTNSPSQLTLLIPLLMKTRLLSSYHLENQLALMNLSTTQYWRLKGRRPVIVMTS